MNIVFNTYPFAFATPGGGEIQLIQYVRHLAARGTDVSKFDLWRGFEQMGDESVMHFSSCMPGSVHFLHACTSRKIPVVVSPNLWVTEETAHEYPFDEIRAVLNVSDAVVCNSNAECELLARVFNLPRAKFFTVYNAVDEIFLEPVHAGIFRDAFGIRGRFVLNVGNIEARKNQLALVRAMKQFPDMTLVVAGHVRDAEYAEQCAVLGGAQWRHIGGLPHASELLRSAYAACEVFALPSTLETPGLAALEAAACGCRVVVTSVGSTTEYFQDGATYAEPNDVDSIASALARALASPSGELRERVARQHTWPVVVQQLLPVYEHLLARKRAMAGYFSANGVQAEGFNEVECNEEGVFVWSRASSSMQVPSGLVAWRWWSLAELEVDLLVDGVVVRPGLLVEKSWAWACLDIPAKVGGAQSKLEIRVRGEAHRVAGRSLGVMLRDLVHLGEVGQADARREKWCLARGLLFDAAGVQGEGFYPVEHGDRGFFAWSRSRFELRMPAGRLRVEGFVAQRCRVTLSLAGHASALLEAECEAGDACLIFDVPRSDVGQSCLIQGDIEKIGSPGHADPRDLGFAITKIAVESLSNK